MHFGFSFKLSNVDLSNIDLLDTYLDLLDTHLDLLDTDIPSKYFAFLQDMSSRRLQDVFSVTSFRLPRRLQDVLQDIFKTSSRRLGRRKIVTLKTC